MCIVFSETGTWSLYPALPSFILNSNTQGKPNDDECSAIRALVEEIGKAYRRAKAERGNKEVLAYMNQYVEAKRPLVKKLIEKDDKFKPGAWYTDSKFSKDSNDRPFKNLVEKVEAHTDVRWESWLPSEEGVHAAPIA